MQPRRFKKMPCLKKSFATRLLIMTSLFFSTAFVFAETATVSWDANTESDLSGYKIYYGTSSGNYDDVLDVGNTTSFIINNLAVGTTYFFVVTAYDFSANESGFSGEVSFTPTQGTPPQITGVSVGDDTKLDVLFSRSLDKASAENPANYSINGGVQVLAASLDADLRTVHLTTSQHTKGQGYVITVTNVTDVDGTSIASGSTQGYNIPADSSTDTTAPQLVSVNVKGATQIDLNFSEPLDKASAEILSNYSISPNIEVIVAALDQNLTRVHLVTSTHQQSVEYTLSVNNIYDRAANPNKVTSNNTVIYTSDGSQEIKQSTQTFSLHQNFPNPFNPDTEISFFLEKQREVELKVYNPLGQLVKTLVSAGMPQGDHKVVWDGTNNDNIQVPSGVYIYSLEVKRDVVKGGLLVNVSLERRVKKMTLLR